jgi:excisionase family DNA binding protein
VARIAEEPRAGLLKASEVAALLSTSVWTVRHLTKTGELRPVRFGARGHLRYEVSDVEALVERSKAAA